MNQNTRLRGDRGASAVEYALVVVLVGGLVLLVTMLGQRVVANFASIENCYDNTCPAGAPSSSAAPTVAAAPAPSSSAPAPAPSSTSRGNNGGGNNTGANNNGGGNGSNGNDD